LAALVTALFVGLPAELRDLSWTSVRGSSSATKTQTLDNDGRHPHHQAELRGGDRLHVV